MYYYKMLSIEVLMEKMCETHMIKIYRITVRIIKSTHVFERPDTLPFPSATLDPKFPIVHNRITTKGQTIDKVYCEL